MYEQWFILADFFQIRAHFDEEKEDDEENDIDSA